MSSADISKCFIGAQKSRPVRVVSSGRSVPSDTSKTAPKGEVDHVLWATEAWTAIVRSLLRAPGRAALAGPSADFIRRYAKRSEDGTAIKWLKFHTSYIFAYAMGQQESELPLPPFPLEEPERSGRPVGGVVGRTIQDAMARGRAGSWRWKRVAYDILMSKLGCPAALKDFVHAAYVNHRTALLKEGSEPTDRMDRWRLRLVELEIARICKRVFGHVSFSHKDPIPSIRACMENGLENAGALGELINSFNGSITDNGYRDMCTADMEDFAPSVYGEYIEPDQLFAMVETDCVRELRFIDMSYRVSDFQNYVDSCWTERLDRPLRAKPIPILEPLKVRMITKGQAAEYYRCVEFQKLMHGALRKEPVFQCIGHPIEGDDWVQTFLSQKELGPNEFFVSGDYKAATDNLDPSLSEWTWKCICSNVRCGWNRNVLLANTRYYNLGLKALTGHVLSYPKGVAPDDSAASLQSWGQLMGSPMSFPILCIVNAAATLVALNEQYTGKNRIRVNGDDIAFIADEESYAEWKQVTHLCGLDFSLGKNYTSRSFIIMNSELRRAPKALKMIPSYKVKGISGDPDSGDWKTEISWALKPKPWKLEGFANQCLMYNTIKKGMDAGKPKDTYWTELSSITQELLRGIPAVDQMKLYGVFFKTYKPVIQGAPHMANKWFPKALGGMGLSLPEGRSVESLLDTEDAQLILQCKQAAYLACNPIARFKRVSLKRPLFGALANTFEDIRRMSDRQVPPLLQQKLRIREQTPILGGATLLGYLFGVTSIAGVTEPSKHGPVPGDGLPVALGGQRPEGDSSQHARVEADLRLRYKKWLGQKAVNHSLCPMRKDHIIEYKEHLEMVSRISVLREKGSWRGMD